MSELSSNILFVYSGAQLRSVVELTPESYYDEFLTMNGDAVARACHSFRRTYAALCDFYDQPYRDEVSWVEMILLVRNLPFSYSQVRFF